MIPSIPSRLCGCWGFLVRTPVSWYWPWLTQEGGPSKADDGFKEVLTALKQ